MQRFQSKNRKAAQIWSLDYARLEHDVTAHLTKGVSFYRNFPGTKYKVELYPRFPERGIVPLTAKIGGAKPDETREFPKGRLELIKIGGATIGRAIFEPGCWRWATSVQPLVKTKSCEARHQYHVSGVLRVKMDDGSEFDCRAGDVSLLPSGHDAWVVGNEPAVVVDFQGMIDYAKSM